MSSSSDVNINVNVKVALPIMVPLPACFLASSTGLRGSGQRREARSLRPVWPCRRRCQRGRRAWGRRPVLRVWGRCMQTFLVMSVCFCGRSVGTRVHSPRLPVVLGSEFFWLGFDLYGDWVHSTTMPYLLDFCRIAHMLPRSRLRRRKKTHRCQFINCSVST